MVSFGSEEQSVNPRVASVWLEDGELKILMPYNAAAVREFKRRFGSGWRWYNRKTHVWSLIATKQEELESFLRQYCSHVVFVGGLEPAIEIPAYAEELAQIIRELPPDLCKKIYRLLIFETHPDRGGNPDLARRINEAFKKIT